MAVGRIRPNEASALAHLNQEASDWVAPAYQNVGGGPFPDHGTLPAQAMCVPTELASGQWFVKDIDTWQFTNDTPGRKSQRRSATITPADVKEPPGQVKTVQAQAKGASSGVVAKPGAEQRRKNVG